MAIVAINDSAGGLRHLRNRIIDGERVRLLNRKVLGFIQFIQFFKRTSPTSAWIVPSVVFKSGTRKLASTRNDLVRNPMQ